MVKLSESMVEQVNPGAWEHRNNTLRPEKKKYDSYYIIFSWN